MNKIEQFFHYCSGAAPAVLNRCPTERSKFVGIGATIFFTGLLAVISSAYALNFIFEGLILPITFGLIWGLMIFNLDRLIVLSMRKSNKKSREYFQALPRVLLAILIALVISKPLELKIFEKEIATELALFKQELIAKNEEAIHSRYVEQMDSLQNESQELAQAIDKKEEKRNELLNLAREEADGTGGSGKVNPGPIYQIKKKNANQAQEELEAMRASNELKDQKILKELQILDEAKKNEVKRIDVADINGISFQLTALNRLGEKYMTIYFANVFIILLFVMLETSPILAKIISPRGPYDDLLEVHEKQFESYRKEKVYKEDQRVEKHLTPHIS